ncbi:family 1 glycosylhydrolase [Roseisolibacter sp. H3M3-2]|uniref:family 1 glycosylhydrolase n=1 Tax=Roseisolibacter sp. H3M3-2 TaxID=3031323 RepID=UPI0023DA4945|nr:family 1 glycosylhydrolase [Roseisolibacter sp. H3M3-2]MDF1502619.1 family 1 glycosylhydrolase [Roseisolibacter sp. H3M3-2]
METHPEVWAGVECTVNRVGERYFDQLARNGHHDRPDDVDRLAALGVRAVRFPVLWERVAPGGAPPDWTWSDARLDRLRALGVRPVVTLLHHGSGPRDTSLVDPAFPERFAAFARAAAERYPWVEDWTPINEPLTTARFSALYGLWYPHATDDRSFALAFAHQMRATALAMREIRAVVPGARLVQTEDLGKVHATPGLAYQAAFENERRWATVDVLAGRLAPGDAFWEYLVGPGGIAPDALRAMVDAPCPPDLVGINHYLTSERFLDRRLSRYPAHAHGGNAWHRYADVEAVRVLGDGCDGPECLLREAWERYRLPIAVTEVHLACTREQQLRWLRTVWEAALRLRADGVDVRAVTAWAALGSFDWNSLLTRDEGFYEPGLFDVRGPEPRPTALATMVRALAAEGRASHPALDGPGWWEMPERLQYPVARKHAVGRPRTRGRLALMAPPASAPRPVLITGARGTLARAIARACRGRALAHVALGRGELDVADPRAVQAALAEHRPWAVVNCAGFVRVDDAERERDACWRENVCGPAMLADACAAGGIALATFSSDLVFGEPAESARPFVEDDPVAPRNVYGASKAEAEHRVLSRMPEALVVRTSAFFGPWDDWNFLTIALRELSAGRPFPALADVTVSPTYVPELADATLDLLIDGERGVWHLASAGALTWHEFARLGAERAGVDASGLRPLALDEARLAAPRPRWSVLGTARGPLLGAVENAICHYLRARAAA